MTVNKVSTFGRFLVFLHYNEYINKSFTMRKVSLNFIIDNLTELGWDYSCGRMSRSGMEIYDGIMRHCGILEKTEHWNEDVYADSNGDW